MLGKIAKSIDTLNEKQGDISALLGIPLLLVVIYEVIMRYVFDAPFDVIQPFITHCTLACRI